VLLPCEVARAQDGAPPRCPWVLHPHGGPHSTGLDSFSVQLALLVASGVAVIIPNYRGSLGYGAAFAQALPGHVGEMDVADCAALTRRALDAFSTELDPERGAVYGGSHGGFLTAWLLGAAEHKALYSCGVLWNPVVDLPAMFGATDIPEWVVAEALGSKEDVRWPLSTAEVAELHRRSPISVVDEVAVPALMILGASDQRVPPSQGRQWTAAVQQLGRSPKMGAISFPGEGHAIASSGANAHAQQTAVAWLVKHLLHPTPSETPTGGT